jgi:hypothetical protein
LEFGTEPEAGTFFGGASGVEFDEAEENVLGR